MRYCSATKRKELLKYATMRTNLKNTLLKEARTHQLYDSIYMNFKSKEISSAISESRIVVASWVGTDKEVQGKFL